VARSVVNSDGRTYAISQEDFKGYSKGTDGEMWYHIGWPAECGRTVSTEEHQENLPYDMVVKFLRQTMASLGVSHYHPARESISNGSANCGTVGASADETEIHGAQDQSL
jgi:hypothetical protein